MAQRTVTIASRVGLHARPAALFVQAVNKAGRPVTIAARGGPAVDASSILSVLTLNAAAGDEVVLQADGEDADGALDELAGLLARDLDA